MIITNKTSVARNPFLIVLVVMLGAAAYVTFTLNLWGPIIQMTTAASTQGVDIAKTKLREWLQETETGRQAIAMSGATSNDTDTISMHTLDGDGKRKVKVEDEVDEDEI